MKNCYEIAKYIRKQELTAPEIEWLEMALKKSVLENDESVKRDILEKKLRRVIKEVWANLKFVNFKRICIYLPKIKTE